MAKGWLFRLVIILMVMVSSNNTFTQTIINSTGNTLYNNNVNIEYSIGEISITTISDNTYQITQGLLQPIFHFKDCNLLNLIPTAFTPNGDNLNDCFGVKKWPATTSYELSVYNRFGQRLFKTDNIVECWNGNFNGIQQPMGTYVYSIKANTAACGQITNKGTIVLIR